MLKHFSQLIVSALALFLTACGGSGATDQEEKTGLIAGIPEASGICYSSTRNSLFVVSDKGIIVEIDTNGKFVRDKSFNSLDKHDFEGVACNDNGDLNIAVEGADNILIVNQSTLNLKNDLNIKRGNILTKDKEFGLEGIAIFEGKVYLSNQSFNAYPDTDPSIIFTIDSLNNPEPEIMELFDHGYRDISGLAFYKNYLYMVSDSDNLLIKYDVTNNQTVFTKQLTKFSVEGITFDEKKHIYFADDDNGKIYKYDISQFGI